MAAESDKTTTATTEDSPPVFKDTLNQDSSISPITTASEGAPTPRDRRESVEWDASKTPPSRFQKRKGSIYAVPASRDGHVEQNFAHKYHEKLVEKGWHKK